MSCAESSTPRIADTDDFSLIVPAQLLAEQRRTQRIFSIVMVALASISLLVGGIGIMNIMLASVLERTREIGIRRAVGARQGDIVRQFLVETVMISFLGGLLGLVFGVGLSRLIAVLAGWSTIVTATSVLLAFLVSVAVGLVFGVYPAAARRGSTPSRRCTTNRAGSDYTGSEAPAPRACSPTHRSHAPAYTPEMRAIRVEQFGEPDVMRVVKVAESAAARG